MKSVSTTLAVGDPAPPFALPDIQGTEVTLEDCLRKGPLLLFFFRGTWCPNCRKQWEELKGIAPTLTGRGLVLRGIVAQSPAALAAYAKSKGFPFPMLADQSREVIKAYGVYHLLGIDAINIARPSTFLVDQGSVVRWIFVSGNQVDRPSREELLNLAPSLEDSRHPATRG